MWRVLWLVLIASELSCSRQASTAPAARARLVVSAAASLQGPFKEIGALLESKRGLSVSFNFGSSGALQKQIEAGAPVDVFASAGVAQMDALEAKGLIQKASRRDFAGNQLVLVVPLQGATGMAIRGFADLAAANVTRIAIGEPKTVPAGYYAQQALTRLGLWKELEPRLVPGSDVRQVLEYVSRSEVDAGLVYASDLQGFESKVRCVATAPPSSHDPIVYPIAVVATSPQPEAARELEEAVCGPEGQAILRKFGFEPR